MALAPHDLSLKPLKWKHRELKDGMAQLIPHLDAAYKLARGLVRNKTDAEDAVQDAYVRAFRYLPAFYGGESRPWLLAIVRNTCYDRLRRSQIESSSAGEDIDRFETDTPSPEAILLQKRDAEALRDALERLPSSLREVLILREWERMPYKDIAEITGLPSGTVMSRLWRARQQLQQSFASQSQIAR